MPRATRPSHGTVAVVDCNAKFLQQRSPNKEDRGRPIDEVSQDLHPLASKNGRQEDACSRPLGLGVAVTKALGAVKGLDLVQVVALLQEKQDVAPHTVKAAKDRQRKRLHPESRGSSAPPRSCRPGPWQRPRQPSSPRRRRRRQSFASSGRCCRWGNFGPSALTARISSTLGGLQWQPVLVAWRCFLSEAACPFLCLFLLACRASCHQPCRLERTTVLHLCQAGQRQERSPGWYALRSAWPSRPRSLRRSRRTPPRRRPRCWGPGPRPRRSNLDLDQARVYLHLCHQRRCSRRRPRCSPSHHRPRSRGLRLDGTRRSFHAACTPFSHLVR